MVCKEKVLFVHHHSLECISGVNIILSELFRLIPSINTSIEVVYLSLDKYSSSHELLDSIHKVHKEISCLIGANLHIENNWELSIKMLDYYYRINKPLYIYIHDYWPHHCDQVKFLIDKFGARLLSSSRYIRNLLTIDGFESELAQVGMSLNNIELGSIIPNRSSPSKKIIASSGRIVQRKRFLDIIRAFSYESLYETSILYLRVLASHVHSSDDDEAELNKLREEINADELVKNSIVIDQNLEKKHNYNKYDIYVCASNYEGFSLTPIESAYSGCPPIISDIPPHQDIAKVVFKDRFSDFIYPVYDYKKLGHLLKDEVYSARRQKYLDSNKNQIQRTIESEFSLMSAAKTIASLV
jgi:glycosyltransferase involved in cell wall biosynthesis